MQTHVFGDASIRLRDARTEDEEGAPQTSLRHKLASSLMAQREARTHDMQERPEMDHDGF